MSVRFSLACPCAVLFLAATALLLAGEAAPEKPSKGRGSSGDVLPVELGQGSQFALRTSPSGTQYLVAGDDTRVYLRTREGKDFGEPKEIYSSPSSSSKVFRELKRVDLLIGADGNLHVFLMISKQPETAFYDNSSVSYARFAPDVKKRPAWIQIADGKSPPSIYSFPAIFPKEKDTLVVAFSAFDEIVTSVRQDVVNMEVKNSRVVLGVLKGGKFRIAQVLKPAKRSDFSFMEAEVLGTSETDACLYYSGGKTIGNCSIQKLDWGTPSAALQAQYRFNFMERASLVAKDGTVYLATTVHEKLEREKKGDPGMRTYLWAGKGKLGKKLEPLVKDGFLASDIGNFTKFNIAEGPDGKVYLFSSIPAGPSEKGKAGSRRLSWWILSGDSPPARQVHPSFGPQPTDGFNAFFEEAGKAEIIWSAGSKILLREIDLEEKKAEEKKEQKEEKEEKTS